MIPIISISNLISGSFFGLCSFKLYLSYKKSKGEKVEDFFKTFFFLAVMFFLLASPGLLIENLKIIDLIFALSPFFAFVALAYLGIIPLKLLNWKKVKTFYFKGIIVAAFLITIFNVWKSGPAVVHHQGQFIYWEDVRGIAMNTLIGLISSVGLLLIIVFFFIHGVKSSERYVRTRSFLITGGLIALMLASVVNFIVGASSQVYLTSLLAIVLITLAGFLILLGIYYKSDKDS